MDSSTRTHTTPPAPTKQQMAHQTDMECSRPSLMLLRWQREKQQTSEQERAMHQEMKEAWMYRAVACVIEHIHNGKVIK